VALGVAVGTSTNTINCCNCNGKALKIRVLSQLHNSDSPQGTFILVLSHGRASSNKYLVTKVPLAGNPSSSAIANVLN